MKIKIVNKCFVGTGGNLMAGEEHEVEDRIAEKLIDRGYAQAVKKAAPKKTTRSVGLKKSDIELNTPESDE